MSPKVSSKVSTDVSSNRVSSFFTLASLIHHTCCRIKTIPHLIGWQLKQDLTLQKTPVVSAKVPYNRRFSKPKVERSLSQAPMMHRTDLVCEQMLLLCKCSASLLSVYEPLESRAPLLQKLNSSSLNSSISINMQCSFRKTI